MKRLTCKAGLLPAVLALLFFAGPVVADDQVPFQGQIAGVAIPDFTDFCNRPATIAGVGNASHLGRFSWASTLVATGFCPVTDPPSPAFILTNGLVTLTAANGDQLFGTHGGTGFVGGAAPPFLVFLDFTVTINGGTGRFTNATGSINVSVVIDTLNLSPPPHLLTATFDGTLSSVGSTKK